MTAYSRSISFENPALLVLRHTLQLVAQLWWKCKSLARLVKLGRARLADVIERGY